MLDHLDKHIALRHNVGTHEMNRVIHAKNKRKGTMSTKTTPNVKLSAVYAKYASKRSIDTTRAAKQVRSRMRTNFAKVCDLDPNIAKVKGAANDGNRWPDEVTKALADYLTA